MCQPQAEMSYSYHNRNVRIKFRQCGTLAYGDFGVGLSGHPICPLSSLCPLYDGFLDHLSLTGLTGLWRV